MYEVRSPPNPFGEVRVKYERNAHGENKRNEAHLKELIPRDDWEPNNYDTLEIMDPETGKESDRITKFGSYWRRWSAGVFVSDIAGVLLFMGKCK